ncbi:MAG: PA0069 family radical SAM protein [Deltaproteobacteria bacterium]|nr:PA0069 family radical SAM protein [bacterium]MCB9476065.1 PA0069 family radical SAM protein [Deltaproteobacteria bacterium]MCB9478245.1 PA0069 family radical SAM protein [Deltaproteobacteria bacterium]MCB9487202.1 PA0069 family radical SAM protein [Deltaproteobacteria bacterium]
MAVFDECLASFGELSYKCTIFGVAVHRKSTEAVKGRGAVSNPTGRFESSGIEPHDDGWGTIDEDEAPFRTTVTPLRVKEIITTNDSPDIGFDQSINPYNGCEHGCVYCFARPSHEYHGLSSGLDFETKIFAKPDAPEVLRRTLAKASYKCRPIAMGTNTDPYQPIERRMGIMRGILEVLCEARHPVGIVTKSDLVLRDLDILTEMSKRNLVRVALSVTTLDEDVARVMEPRAARPAKRLEAIRRLAAAGIPTGVMAAPMIPAINDKEMEAILEAAAERGATSGGYILVRLPYQLKAVFEDWLRTNFPDRADRVLSLIRQTRGGKLYDADWRVRQIGEGPYAHLLGKRFEVIAARLGLNARNYHMDATHFRHPRRDVRQAALFDV